jgi:hypothetical protein
MIGVWSQRETVDHPLGNGLKALSFPSLSHAIHALSGAQGFAAGRASPERLKGSLHVFIVTCYDKYSTLSGKGAPSKGQGESKATGRSKTNVASLKNEVNLGSSGLKVVTSLKHWPDCRVMSRISVNRRASMTVLAGIGRPRQPTVALAVFPVACHSRADRRVAIRCNGFSDSSE